MPITKSVHDPDLRAIASVEIEKRELDPEARKELGVAVRYDPELDGAYDAFRKVLAGATPDPFEQAGFERQEPWTQFRRSEDEVMTWEFFREMRERGQAGVIYAWIGLGVFGGMILAGIHWILTQIPEGTTLGAFVGFAGAFPPVATLLIGPALAIYFIFRAMNDAYRESYAQVKLIGTRDFIRFGYPKEILENRGDSVVGGGFNMIHPLDGCVNDCDPKARLSCNHVRIPIEESDLLHGSPAALEAPLDDASQFRDYLMLNDTYGRQCIFGAEPDAPGIGARVLVITMLAVAAIGGFVVLFADLTTTA